MHKHTIIHFSQDFAKGKSQLGGFSRIFNLCSDKNYHFIFTISKDNSVMEDFMLADNIQVVSIPLKFKELNKVKQLFNYKFIAKEIHDYLTEKKIRPYLLFGHSQIVNFFILHQVKKLFNTNMMLIWEMNVIWGIHRVEGIKGIIANKLNKYFQKKILLKADQVICQTTSSKNFTIEKFDIKENKFWVIPNSVNIDKPLAERITSEQAAKKNKVLCLGLFDKMNGIPFFASLLEHHDLPAFQFFFIGDGLYQPQVKLLHKKNKCTYLGKLPYKEMKKKYAEFDFVIIPRLPVLEADLFIPTKLVEAMYYGLIPICSNVLGMTEIVEDKKNGFVFTAGDEEALLNTLTYVSTLPATDLMQISYNSQCTIYESYNWQNNYKVLDKVYSQSATS